MPILSEDEIYRSSSQFRLWSFTPESLAQIRAQTNANASNAVKAAIAHKYESNATNGSDDITKPEMNVDCLTVEEELKLIGHYCVKTMELSDFCSFPTNVKATAVQFMKRFYLSNSPMTYHPKEIMLSALFLSTKTENHFTKLSTFASKLPKTTPEDVIAPEFLLTQGLRFAFDVRHPQRGLSGGAMDLFTMAKGDEGDDVQEQMKGIGATKAHPRSTKTPKDLEKRIGASSDRAGTILKTSALLSDVYFHFTPSQIWLSAFLLADEPLAKLYIDRRLAGMGDLKRKLIQVLSKCCTMLEDSPSAQPGTDETKELKRIDKKLYKCRNPDKMDLVGLNQAQKRQGDEQNGLDEKTIKKRKLEREKNEKDDPFGPPLVVSKQPTG